MRLITIFNTLRNLRGSGTELISLYVPSGRVSDASQMLRDELGKASNIKSRVTRNSVTSGIKSALERLKMASGNVAIFVGPTSDGWISEIVNVHKPLSSIIYRCGNIFDLSVLDGMVEKGPKYAIICIDLSEFDLAILQGVNIDYRLHDESIVPAKQGQGGQSNKRYEKNRQLAIISWFKSSADKINEILLDEGLAGIIISGAGLTKNDFCDGEYLHHELRKKIVGVIDTGYTGMQGIKETITNSGDLLNELELVKQRKVMSEFFKRLVNDDRVTYGNKSVIEYLNDGRVNTLLISSQDKGLAEIADKFNTKIIVIDSGFEEGAQLKNVFGGIAALLRY